MSTIKERYHPLVLGGLIYAQVTATNLLGVTTTINTGTVTLTL